MQNLLDAVKQVKQTIQTHRADLVTNEALTRYALVDVILNALGWDVHDPGKVYPEYNKGMNGGRADYALLGEGGKPVAIVEAKKLGNIANNDLYQVTKYAYDGAISYALITDGNTWIIADAFKKVPPVEKEIIRFKIETEPDNLLLIKLVALMPVNLVVPERAFFPNAPAVSKHVTPEPKVSQARTPEPVQSVKPAASTTPVGFSENGWKPLDSYNYRLLKEAGKPTRPIQLRTPNGIILTPTSWRNVLELLAEFLIKAGKLPNTPIYDAGNKQRYLLNNVPFHPNKNKFEYNYALSNGWFLDVNWHTGIYENTVQLLRAAGEDPNKYYFQ